MTPALRPVAERTPGRDHVRLAGEGHVPQLEDADGFVAAVTDWIRRRGL